MEKIQEVVGSIAAGTNDSESPNARYLVQSKRQVISSSHRTVDL